VDASQVWPRRAGHCRLHRGVLAMVPDSIVKPDSELVELSSFSTALTDGVMDKLNQGFPIKRLV
jgi:hypothetical protein